jgi:hypothetical protein
MPGAVAEERPYRGQVKWRSVVGWEGQTAGPDGLAKRECYVCRGQNSGQPSDGLTLVYLVELDGDATD